MRNYSIRQSDSQTVTSRNSSRMSSNCINDDNNSNNGFLVPSCGLSSTPPQLSTFSSGCISSHNHADVNYIQFGALDRHSAPDLPQCGGAGSLENIANRRRIASFPGGICGGGDMNTGTCGGLCNDFFHSGTGIFGENAGDNSPGHFSPLSPLSGISPGSLSPASSAFLNSLPFGTSDFRYFAPNGDVSGQACTFTSRGEEPGCLFGGSSFHNDGGITSNSSAETRQWPTSDGLPRIAEIVGMDVDAQSSTPSLISGISSGSLSPDSQDILKSFPTGHFDLLTGVPERQAGDGDSAGWSGGQH